jgi:hypothetical protein
MPRHGSTQTARSATYDAGNDDQHIAVFRIDKDDALVWEQPGFDKYEFYAAAQYLQRHEKNQGFYKSNNTQRSAIRNGLSTDKATCEMLDCLALLFARVKNSKASPEHVTATALKRTEQCVEIWIAKNHGPRVADENFRTDLERWFNNKGAWTESASLMATDIASFWRSRLEYYNSNITLLWKQLCPVEPDKQKVTVKMDSQAVPVNEVEDDLPSVSAVYVALHSIYEEEKVNMDEFKSNWKKVKTFCMKAKLSFEEIIQLDETTLPTEKQSYMISPEGKPTDHFQMTRKFSKLLKHLRLLGTIHRATRAFITFRDRVNNETPIRLMFLDAIRCPPLSAEVLESGRDHLRRWMNSTTNPQFKQELQDLLDARDYARNSAKKPLALNRYFHCELQMLDKFLHDPLVNDYFGCSKLSCYMCWGVLRGSPFRTRDTHANLWSACAFPFNLEGQDSNKRYELLIALKRTQDHVIEKVLRRSIDPKFTFGDTTSVAETWPEGELWDRNGTRTRTTPEQHRIMTTRAIHIPQDHEPVPKMVEFYCSSHWGLVPTLPPDVIISYERIIPYTWFVNSELPCSGDVFSKQVMVDDGGLERSEIRICASRNIEIKSSNVPSSGIRVNQWYKNVIKDIHDYEYDPADPICRWKGDLYIYRSLPLRRRVEVRPIEPEEVPDVIGKSRQVLSNIWVSSVEARKQQPTCDTSLADHDIVERADSRT